jgi:hypothetical protein
MIAPRPGGAGAGAGSADGGDGGALDGAALTATGNIRRQLQQQEHHQQQQRMAASDAGARQPNRAQYSAGSGAAAAAAGTPAWEEELALDIPPELLTSEDALLLAELLQLPSSFRDYNRRLGSAAAGAGGYAGQPVAWGFARLKGLGELDGSPLRLKLQLYKYRPVSGDAYSSVARSLARLCAWGWLVACLPRYFT